MKINIKRLIEWAFKNYKANLKAGAEEVAELAESGLINK